MLSGCAHREGIQSIESDADSRTCRVTVGLPHRTVTYRGRISAIWGTEEHIRVLAIIPPESETEVVLSAVDLDKQMVFVGVKDAGALRLYTSAIDRKMAERWERAFSSRPSGGFLARDIAWAAYPFFFGDVEVRYLEEDVEVPQGAQICRVQADWLGLDFLLEASVAGEAAHTPLARNSLLSGSWRYLGAVLGERDIDGLSASGTPTLAEALACSLDASFWFHSAREEDLDRFTFLYSDGDTLHVDTPSGVQQYALGTDFRHALPSLLPALEDPNTLFALRSKAWTPIAVDAVVCMRNIPYPANFSEALRKSIRLGGTLSMHGKPIVDIAPYRR